MTIVTLASATLDANDPRRDACVYQYCGQLASYACTAPHGATVNLCEEHATGFGRVWGVGTAGPCIAPNGLVRVETHRWVSGGDGPTCERCNGLQATMAGRPCPADRP